MSNVKPNKNYSFSCALFICALASTYTIFDFFFIVAPSVMVRQLRTDFSIGATSIGLLGASFYIAYALMQMPSGWLIDRFGARKLLSLTAAITGFSVILFSTTHQFYLCLLARLLMGIGVSTAFIGNYYLAGHLLKHRYFSFVAALLHMFGSIGAVLAQGPLALLVNRFGWRTPMFVSGVIVLLMAALFALFLRDGKGVNSSHKEAGTEHLIKKAKPQAFLTSMKYIARHSQIKWIALCGFMGWLPLSVLGALWCVPYLMRAYHITNVEASNICSFFWMGSAIGGLVLSFFSEMISSRKKPILYCFYGEFIVAIIIIEAPNLPIWLVSIALFFLGICVCMQTLSFTLIKETVSPRFFALAMGANNTGAMVSSAIGQHLVGFLLDLQAGPEQIYKTLYFQNAMFIFLIAAMTGIWICQNKIEETHCRIHSHNDLKHEV